MPNHVQDHEPAVRRFFQAYQDRMNAALEAPPKVDVAAATAAFARYFVGSNPKTVSGGRNGWFLRFMIPRGYAFYRKIGTRRMEVRGLEVEALDDFHAMARTHWWSSYRKKSGETVEIEFDNIYFLHIPASGEPKIFAYVTGDEQQVLKDHGLV
jgi:hypothetical protein